MTPLHFFLFFLVLFKASFATEYESGAMDIPDFDEYVEGLIDELGQMDESIEEYFDIAPLDEAIAPTEPVEAIEITSVDEAYEASETLEMESSLEEEELSFMSLCFSSLQLSPPPALLEIIPESQIKYVLDLLIKPPSPFPNQLAPQLQESPVLPLAISTRIKLLYQLGHSLMLGHRTLNSLAALCFIRIVQIIDSLLEAQVTPRLYKWLRAVRIDCATNLDLLFTAPSSVEGHRGNGLPPLQISPEDEAPISTVLCGKSGETLLDMFKERLMVLDHFVTVYHEPIKRLSRNNRMALTVFLAITLLSNDFTKLMEQNLPTMISFGHHMLR